MQNSTCWQNKNEKATPQLDLFYRPQCSRASVTLADKLPPIFGERVPTPSKRQDAPVSLGFSPPSAGRDNGAVSIEGASKGLFSEGDSERGATSVAEDIPPDGEQAQDDSEADNTWNRVRLELSDVCVEKVVEKEALGSTAKGAMAVSCREVRRRGCGKCLCIACVRDQVRLTRNPKCTQRKIERGGCVRCLLSDTC